MREKIDEKLPLSCTLSESENDDDPLASIKGSDLKPQSLQAKLKLVEEVEDSLLVKELKKAC